MRLFYLETTDPAFNLAMEELLAQSITEPAFMLWRNRPSIIVGCHQNTSAEIDLDVTAVKGIQVVRRITGGGAVYHDLGNLNYSCVSLEREWGPESAGRFAAPIVSALNALGVSADFSGRNDILVNGRKVSGCARSVPRNHTLFHGTLLFDTDLKILADALKPDPDKILSKGIKSVRARVGNIREMLPDQYSSLDMDGFIAHMLQHTCNYFGEDAFERLPEKLYTEAEKLATSKYRTWEWNFGTNLAYQVHGKLHFNGGRIYPEYNVKNNVITDLRFTGDYFGSLPIDELIGQLNGLVPKEDVLLEKLTQLNLQDYISGITAQELARAMTIIIDNE